MAFHSVLFDQAASGSSGEDRPAPAFFTDLNLDQVIDAATVGKGAYHLSPLFYNPLSDLDTIRYRQEVFQDLERPAVREVIGHFAEADLVAKFKYRIRDMQNDDMGLGHYHRVRLFLNAAVHYCRSVARLASGFSDVGLRSRGLRGLHEYLTGYVNAQAFLELRNEAGRLEGELGAIRYCLLIKGNRITVGAFDEEFDYNEQVAATFDRFQQGAVPDYLPNFRDWETYTAAGVIHLVAKAYPGVFNSLDNFYSQHQDYLDDKISRFDREIQFYLAYLSYIEPLRAAGLPISYPQMSGSCKNEQVRDTFDLALASQLTSQGTSVVANDISLTDPERILVVSGPNSGGNTTLARTFGQLHYLARLGCPVPGREVRLFLCDQIFSHFERAEDLDTLTGKLQEELDRLKADLDQATPNSVLILNEVFNSTTAQDALFLSRQVLDQVADLDALCICVTFLDELASMNKKTVSMVSTVIPDDPATRTYKIVRRPADGRAYAHALAVKYGLTFDRLTAEIHG